MSFPRPLHRPRAQRGVALVIGLILLVVMTLFGLLVVRNISGDERMAGYTYDRALALLGVGATPNDEIARDAGLECARGVVVNLEARTADPSVFAIGDVTHRPMPHYGRMFGPESVPSALEQAKQAASAITGSAPLSIRARWEAQSGSCRTM